MWMCVVVTNDESWAIIFHFLVFALFVFSLGNWSKLAKFEAFIAFFGGGGVEDSFSSTSGRNKKE